MQTTKSQQYDITEEENAKTVNREQLAMDILSLTDEQAEYVLRRLLCKEQQ